MLTIDKEGTARAEGGHSLEVVVEIPRQDMRAEGPCCNSGVLRSGWVHFEGRADGICWGECKRQLQNDPSAFFSSNCLSNWKYRGAISQDQEYSYDRSRLAQG